MPAKSKSQQQLFGLALSVKRGETPRSEVSDEVLDIVDNMSEDEIEDYAETEHKGLPDKKEETMKEQKEFDLRSFLTENTLTDTSKYLKETSKTAILTDFLKDKITFDELVKKAGSVERIATKQELKKFLNNSFMQDVMADTHGVDKRTLVTKVKELLKKI